MWLSSGRSGSCPSPPSWSTDLLAGGEQLAVASREAEPAQLDEARGRVGHLQRDVVEVVVVPASAPRRGPAPDPPARRTPCCRRRAARARAPSAARTARRSRSVTSMPTSASGPRSRSPSAANSVSLPRRASAPTSVNASVRSISCIPTCVVRKSASRSRSATQSATWSRLSMFILRPRSYPLRSPSNLAAQIRRCSNLDGSSWPSARTTCITALISARWVNACGKLPRWRPVRGSSSSA